jgi:deoxyribonuclease-4
MWLGAHVPTAGGLCHAPKHGADICADAIQIFTRNQRQWLARAVGRREARAFHEAVERHGMRLVVAHASYLLNLASPDSRLLTRSRRALLDEVRRCETLGVPMVVVHAGSHMGSGPLDGIRRMAESLDFVVERRPESPVVVLIEGTAGQGTNIGGSFEHLAAILSRARHPERLGVCLDTCHLFAAGYDLRSRSGYRATWQVFDQAIGRSHLRLLHVNDTLSVLGSRRDRHASLGRGSLGMTTFRRLMKDPALARVPKILETPGGLLHWKRELAQLRRMLVRR